jgi:hypothetical protein
MMLLKQKHLKSKQPALAGQTQMTGIYQPKEQRAAKQRETRTANFSIGNLQEGRLFCL